MVNATAATMPRLRRGWTDFEWDCLTSPFGEGPARDLIGEWFGLVTTLATECNGSACLDGPADMARTFNEWSTTAEEVYFVSELMFAAVGRMVLQWAADTDRMSKEMDPLPNILWGIDD